jgi:hypothetical protein
LSFYFQRYLGNADGHLGPPRRTGARAFTVDIGHGVRQWGVLVQADQHRGCGGYLHAEYIVLAREGKGRDVVGGAAVWNSMHLVHDNEALQLGVEKPLANFAKCRYWRHQRFVYSSTPWPQLRPATGSWRYAPTSASARGFGRNQPKSSSPRRKLRRRGTE